MKKLLGLLCAIVLVSGMARIAQALPIYEGDCQVDAYNPAIQSV